MTIVIIKLKLWPAAGCEAKAAAELSSRPLVVRKMYLDGISYSGPVDLEFFSRAFLNSIFL